ncbi:STAS domain-containing protein [Deefgea piscis]|uniref:STAS domain-containing protein n=1 Tax=Deefgea piscis TaxID=2739061 RepID=UPI001C825516|nr:STAS domain-containing protein [Deefgea piscis]QZA81113.1 STAS domain-containing protein [Deefgea piscis]
MTELILNGEQTIYQVRDTYQQLKSIMNESKGLSLSLQQIQECDCAFVQLLLWVKQRLSANSSHCSCCNRLHNW